MHISFDENISEYAQPLKKEIDLPSSGLLKPIEIEKALDRSLEISRAA